MTTKMNYINYYQFINIVFKLFFISDEKKDELIEVIKLFISSLHLELTYSY